MLRQCRQPIWPFLGVLACLFVLSAVAPRTWERTIRPRSAPFPEIFPDFGGGAERSILVPGTPELAASSQQGPRLSPIPDLVRAPAAKGKEEGRPLSQLDMALERVGELQMAVPAQKLANRPAHLSWPELHLPDPVVPSPSAEQLGEEAYSPSQETGASGFTLNQPWLVGPSPPAPLPEDNRDLNGVEGITVILPEDVPSMRQPPVSSAPGVDGVWRRPGVLFKRLDVLAWDYDTGQWAREVARLVRRLGLAMSEASDETVSLVDQLAELADQADALAAELGEDPRADRLRRAQDALSRRLDLWQDVLTIGGPFLTTAALAEPDPQRLSASLAKIEAITGNSPEGRRWQEYLVLDALKELVQHPVTAERERGRPIARKTLLRLYRPNLTDQQRRFLSSGPLAELASELRKWVSGPVNLADLIRHIEEYEETGSPEVARLLADEFLRMELSPLPEQRALSRRLQGHYRGGNIRIAVTEDLLNRLIPDRDPEYQWVRDTILDTPVHGRSLTRSEVTVRMMPDPNRVRMALKIEGLVSALTSSSSGPATFYNDSQSTYSATKRMELDMSGLHLWPAEISVDNQTRLRSLETDFDAIPLVGSLVYEMARSQHEQNRQQISREVKQKVYVRAKRQIDEEADARLGQLSERLRQRILEPLATMSLGPTMIRAETTENRMTMQLRLATAEQLGGHTLRPWAPSDSLASCQLHQSAFNNLVRQMELDSATLTVAELRARIAEKFNRPEMLEKQTENDDVQITFARHDAARVWFQDGRIGISLSIRKLRKSPRRWENFQVLAFYRPVTTGRSVELVRDGVVQLIARRNMGSQIALRGIFSKIFSRQKPWKVVPEILGSDPRMDGLAVTQFVIDDGWIGMAFGPRRPDSGSVLARRPAESVGD